mmetsp:Transcript_21827/g.24162  ORF Transcript_21827/g.24162 Transcript_21827/m.24162 type:complete len:183 (-) Transcript_21827:428-976(-)
MKPDWDRLMKDFENDPTKLVADVDCTTEDGEVLCQQHDVQGFPSLKWGDPSNLEEYNGGREYEELKAFADENLKPMCSVQNIDLCDEEQKSKIEEFQKLSEEELSKIVTDEEVKLSANEKQLEEDIEKLQASYENLMKEKDEKDKVIRDGGLGYMKAVLASKQKASLEAEDSADDASSSDEL